MSTTLPTVSPIPTQFPKTGMPVADVETSSSVFSENLTKENKVVNLDSESEDDAIYVDASDELTISKSDSPRKPSKNVLLTTTSQSTSTTNSTASSPLISSPRKRSPQKQTAKKTYDAASEVFYYLARVALGIGSLFLIPVFQRSISLNYPWRVASAVISLSFFFFADSIGSRGVQSAAKKNLLDDLSAQNLTDSANFKAQEPVKPNQPVGIVNQGSLLCFVNVALQAIMHQDHLKQDVIAQSQAAEKHFQNFLDFYQLLFFVNKMPKLLHRSREAPITLTEEQAESVLLLLAQQTDFVNSLESGDFKSLIVNLQQAIRNYQPLTSMISKNKNLINETLLGFKKLDRNHKVRKFLVEYKAEAENLQKGFKAALYSINTYSEAVGKKTSIDLSGGWTGGGIAPMRYLLGKNPSQFSHEDPQELLQQLFKINLGIKPSSIQIKKEEIRVFAPLKLEELRDEERQKIETELQKRQSPEELAKLSVAPPDLVLKSSEDQNIHFVLTLHPQNGTDGQILINQLTKQPDQELKADLNNLHYFKNSENVVSCYYQKLNSYSEILELPESLTIKIDRFHEGKKVTSLVNMPDVITVKDEQYRKAVAIEHYGKGASGGHYAAHVIQREDQWYINEEFVIGNDPIPSSDRETDEYYLYFYVKILKGN